MINKSNQYKRRVKRIKNNKQKAGKIKHIIKERRYMYVSKIDFNRLYIFYK